MEKTNSQQIEGRMASLISECRSSGLCIDEFLTKKMSEIREDGAKCAETILKTLAEIDSAYASLLQAKANGQNRQEWLRERLESAISDTGTDNKREEVGYLLASTVDALKGEKKGTTAPQPFEGIDAVDMVSEVEDALAKSAIDPVAKEMESL